MTRAERHLYLSWARVRRRFGGSPPEPCIASRFLREIPTPLVKRAGAGASASSPRREVDLFGEQYEVRNSVRKNLYTGKTYNSVENISQYFKERGDAASIPRSAVEAARKAASAPVARPPVSPPIAAKPAQPPGANPVAANPIAAKPVFGNKPVIGKPPAKKSRMSAGATINHPTLGRGTIVRVEGDGPDAKVTVSFPGHGLKKLIAKYAGLTDE
jgi:DNA helicase II / ATP-dependent DNA helicase PcrA